MFLFYGIEEMTIISYLYRTLQFTKTHLKPFFLLTTTFRRYQCSGRSFQFADKERGLRDGKRFGAGDRASSGRVSLRSRTRETGGFQEQNGAFEWRVLGDKWLLSDSRRD